MEEKYQTAKDLSLSSGLSEDAAIVMLSKLDEKDREIRRLRDENEDLKNRLQSSSKLGTILEFIQSSWEPIIILFFVSIPFAFILMAGMQGSSNTAHPSVTTESQLDK